MMKPNKFSFGDKIVVLNLKVNDVYRDITGTFDRYLLNRITRKWQLEVVVNDARLILDESKVIDYNEWTPKGEEK